MRPDRIIVGECRAGEALDMIQAMTVGHDGSLSTGHANSPPDMLRRLETMVLMAGVELPLRSIREQIASAVDLIVHTARLKDGSRKIVNITEVYGIEDDEILAPGRLRLRADRRSRRARSRAAQADRDPADLHGAGSRPAGSSCRPGSSASRPRTRAAGPDPAGQGQVATPGQGSQAARAAGPSVGLGRAVKAGGMVYVSSIGPVDPRDRPGRQRRRSRSRRASAWRNLKAQLEAEGSSLDKVVWANWSLRDPSEFDAFNEEWAALVPGRRARSARGR